MPDKALETLRELLNRRPRTDWPYRDQLATEPVEGMPPVPPAPMFRPGTEVIGPPHMQKAVEGLFKVAPEMRGRVFRVQDAPISPAIRLAMASKMPVHDLPFSNLAGMYETAISPHQPRSIYINPLYSFPYMEPQMLETLAHEFGHAKGYSEGSHEIKELERLSKFIPR